MESLITTATWCYRSKSRFNFKNALMKVLDLEMMKITKKEGDEDNNHKEIDNEQAKKIIKESEVLNKFEDEHIIKTYGFFFGDEKVSFDLVNFVKKVFLKASTDYCARFISLMTGNIKTLWIDHLILLLISNI